MLGKLFALLIIQKHYRLLSIDPPTLQMTFMTNDSPFVGREGDSVTARKLEDRLKVQLHTDVSLRVEDTDSPDAMDRFGSWGTSFVDFD